ncbi:MAG TPA: PP2C family protein-serine/threonine phosphatase [Vicinamibacterales bacterium]|nr:PP2C family protein-serine/threonine phosphatase [Vicinamibacterales bacterium]
MTHRPSRLADFFDNYTKDLTAEDLQRLFTRDTRDAYKFFTRGRDADAMQRMRWHRRAIAEARILFLAFSMKLSPARRVVFGAALLLAVIGLFNLFRGVGIIEILRLPFVGGVGVPGPLFRQGTWSLFFAFALMNLLVLLEVADRLSLKNDLEIARDIQQAMLPSGLYTAAGVETVGMSRPANTVGGDFYDILPLDDGRLVITLGDVAGKGSPAALLMALLLAMLRTLVDEKLEPADLITRLNVQVCRHAPGTRFITLFYGVFDPRTGSLTYVSAGHMPPLLLRGDGTCERLTDGGISLGMFEHSTYTTGQVVIQPEDLFAVYSDGITEAESQKGIPFDEIGLETALKDNQHERLADVGAGVVRAVERYTDSHKFADDLTILLLRRCTTPAAAAV